MYAPYKDIQVVQMDNLCEKSPESDWDVQERLKRRNNYETRHINGRKPY